MQRVVCVKWSLDDRYILSGSDEMNIRLWKANASEKLGMEKFSNHPQVRRILQHRHVPKAIYSESKIQKTMRYSRKRKEANRRAHTKPGTVPHIPERKKPIVTEES
ncbi:hypothetical protein LSH36_276g03053 [Paralvinella palmiformis]|uniref:Sof1-like protein domain-containing protein n=1 Tax=Paralvinella palmiformis TaxID=53620 RepID=A0AAD9JKF6_9ANNE|nr:hypothetical protein LSH36_276g03053 [Paralvinella palmiformis]